MAALRPGRGTGRTTSSWSSRRRQPSSRPPSRARCCRRPWPSATRCSTFSARCCSCGRSKTGQYEDLREALRDRWHQPTRQAFVPGLPRGAGARPPGRARRVPERLRADPSPCSPPTATPRPRPAAQASTSGLGVAVYDQNAVGASTGRHLTTGIRYAADDTSRQVLSGIKDSPMNFRLRCHLCQTVFPAGALWVCDALSRSARGRVRLRRRLPSTMSREMIESGPRTCGATASCCRSRASRGRACIPASRRSCGDRLARQAPRRARALRQGRLGQPSDVFLQGPRRVGGGHARRRAGLHHVRLRVDRQPRRTASPRTPRVSVSPARSSSRTISRRARSPAPASTSPRIIAVRGNYDDVNRLCTQVADQYGWGFANINLRAYYAEGAKTYGFEIAEQLGWRIPAARRLAGRRRHAAAAHPEGLRRDSASRPRRRRHAGDPRGAGRRMRARRRRARSAVSSSPSRSSRRRSPSRLRSAIRPTASRCCAPCDPPAAAARRSRKTTSSAAFSSWPRPKASSRRPPAA